MVETRQLHFFVVCADAGSFNVASKLLYTTQSNVSKTIQNLEKELDTVLFYRTKQGILLTQKGQELYEKATLLLESMEELHHLSETDEEEWIHIAMNPSARFAELFAEFYQLYEKEHLRFQIFSGSTDEIFERVKKGVDEVGFVYISKENQESLFCQMKKHGLCFEPICDVEKAVHMIDGNAEKNTRFIQRFDEEPFKQMEEGMDVAIITNSDYMIRTMLENHLMAKQEQSAIYGAIVAKSISLSKPVKRLITFLEKNIGNL